MQNIEPGVLLTPLNVEDLTLDGQGIARFEGRVVFLDSGLPGEVVSARVTGVKKRLILAKTIEQLKKSDHEVIPFCPHFGQCGGCSLQNYRYEETLAWKQRQVRETLRRLGGFEEKELTVLPTVPSPGLQAFRNKMSFAFGFSSDGRPVLGLREKSSHTLVEVTECGLMDRAAMAVLENVREFTRREGMGHWNGQSGALRHLVLRMPDFIRPGEEPRFWLEVIVSEEGAGQKEAWRKYAAQLARAAFAGNRGTFTMGGFTLSQRNARSALAQGERTLFTEGETVFQEAFGPLVLDVPQGAFLQTNTGLASLLFEKVSEQVALGEQEVVWDLFCGAGSLALYLAARRPGNQGSAYGVDIQKESIRAARLNARRLGLEQCSFEADDVLKGVQKRMQTGSLVPDVILADPPRAGLGAKLAGVLTDIPARCFIYISCDPATLARDLKTMKNGWKLECVQPYDMFPHTTHVESLAILCRK